jgi:hypothetical protein
VPSRSEQVNVRLDAETRAMFRALCRWYGFSHSQLVTDMVRQRAHTLARDFPQFREVIADGAPPPHD